MDTSLLGPIACMKLVGLVPLTLSSAFLGINSYLRQVRPLLDGFNAEVGVKMVSQHNTIYYWLSNAYK